METKSKRGQEKKTYNTRDSPVVTHLSTSLAISSLSRAERTGCRVLYCLWSYVTVWYQNYNFMLILFLGVGRLEVSNEFNFFFLFKKNQQDALRINKQEGSRYAFVLSFPTLSGQENSLMGGPAQSGFFMGSHSYNKLLSTWHSDAR